MKISTRDYTVSRAKSAGLVNQKDTGVRWNSDSGGCHGFLSGAENQRKVTLPVVMSYIAPITFTLPPFSRAQCPGQTGVSVSF
jgi:hypothetical protein